MPDYRTHSRKDTLRYKFDNLMGRGSAPLLGALILVFLGTFFVIAAMRVILVNIIGVSGDVERGNSAWRQIYVTFLEVTDPGSMTQDVDSPPSVKVLAILAGMIGLVLLSALIAFITTALDERLRELRRGRSTVVASDHTVILGWNERMADVIKELILANESEKSGTVVVLADMDKEDMDEYLHTEVPERITTQVVTRRGNPTVLADLDLVSLDTCRSVIVLAGCTNSAAQSIREDSDIDVVKRVLAIFAMAGEDFDAPIICEVFNEAERQVLEELAPGQAIALDSSEILARILVQTSRSIGLSAVYEEILSFDRSEMYVFEDAGWAGLRFGDASYRLPDGVALGYMRDTDVVLNPPADAALQSGDSLLVLANDDSTLGFASQPVAVPEEIDLRGGQVELHPERILIIGWTPKAPMVVSEYDDYLESGSEILIVSRANLDPQPEIDALQPTLDNVTVSVSRLDPLKIENLAGLNPGDFDEIILLSQGRDSEGDEQATDSQTILILLLLRKLLADSGQAESTKLITEILQSSNSPLIRHIGGHDIIVSNRLVSTISSQLSENPELRVVYDNLFSEDGSELYLKPIELYCEPGAHSFATFMSLAQKRSEVAIGFRHVNVRENQGVRLIPEKDEVVSMQAGDLLIVMAEDER